ncbi:unnamed protein product [Withania somnifera]
MAEPKVVCTCAFLLTLIFFSYGILLSEERVLLKTEKNNNIVFSHHNGENSQKKVGENNFMNNIGHHDHSMHGNVNISEEGGPGHSPGVGHGGGPP